MAPGQGFEFRPIGEKFTKWLGNINRGDKKEVYLFP